MTPDVLVSWHLLAVAPVRVQTKHSVKSQQHSHHSFLNHAAVRLGRGKASVPHQAQQP